MGGRPVQIVVSKYNHSFELDEDALSQILLQDHVRDKSVVIVSVVGAFRKGKSFLLDFFLRYMVKQGSYDWMGREDEPLTGFSWRGGSERNTTGILLWSEVFVVDLPSGEQVAVILMDTQGSFDSESTMRDCITVFGLSTLLSSVLVYNLQGNIQEDDLQHLQFFTEYGKLALDDSGHTPFQKLQFLVRDWTSPSEADYGAEGGEKLLNRRLQVSDEQHPELQSLRKHIRSYFTDISCFLMPHPGLKVATNREFDGKLSDIEPDFKKQLQKLVPLILAPKNLAVKEICGEKVKAKDLFQYFKSYIEIFRGDKLPEPKSLFHVTAEVNNEAVVTAAVETYKTFMKKLCYNSECYLNTEEFEAEHHRFENKALNKFINERKMGGKSFSETYKKKLEKELEDLYEEFRMFNKNKKRMKVAEEKMKISEERMKVAEESMKVADEKKKINDEWKKIADERKKVADEWKMVADERKNFEEERNKVEDNNMKFEVSATVTPGNIRNPCLII